MKKIELSQGLFASVDNCDFKELSKYKWSATKSAHGTYYAMAKIEGKSISMHQKILGKKKGLIIDHIDLDGLNNQRNNLRHISRSQNGMNGHIRKNNTTGVPGVYIYYGKYQVQIGINGKKIRIGQFLTLEEAKEARRIAEERYFPDIIKKDRHRISEIKVDKKPAICKRWGNISNTGVRGIYKHGNKWYGRFKKEGKYIFTGQKESIELAKNAYDKLILFHFGNKIKL